MKANRTSLFIIGLLSLAFIYLNFFLGFEDVNTKQHEEAIQMLERIKTFDDKFNEKALMVSQSMINNYDVFIELDHEITDLQKMLRNSDEFNVSEQGRSFTGDVESLFEVIDHKLDLMEQLKADRALLLNSKFYLPTAMSNMRPYWNDGQHVLLGEIVTLVYLYIENPSEQVSAQVATLIQQLAREDMSLDAAKKVKNIFLHINVILSKGKSVNDYIYEILDLPTSQMIKKLNHFQQREYANHVRQAEYFTFILSLFATVLLFYVLLIVYRQQRLAHELKDAVTELEYQKFALDQHSIVAVTDKSGKIIHANDKFCEISQYSRDELLGKDHRILNSGYHPRSFFVEMWKTIGHGKIWRGEVKNARKDGTFYWVDTTLVPLINDENRIDRYVAIRTDISVKKAAEEKNKMLARFPAENPTPVMRIDENGAIAYANNASRVLLTHWDKKVGEKLPSRLDKVVQSVVGKAQHTMVEEQFGDNVFEILFSSVEGNNDVYVYARNVTKLKSAMNEALEASRMKSMFLSTVSHEIRTPMNGIIGMSDLLLDTELSAVQKDFAKTIRSSSDALLTIINDILDFSKIESGHFEIGSESFSLLSAVEGAAGVIAIKAREKMVSLQTYVDPELPAFLIGDAGRLRQVMLNMMDNAVKFTDEGEVWVSVKQVHAAGKQVRVKFEIRDTGIGLSDEAQAKLFQPFVQADGSTTRKYGGTGLGLAICKRIVELMGGTIVLESELGKGSTFSFELEFPIDSNMTEQDAGFNTQFLEGTHVLVIDDDPTACFILEQYLSSWGMHVTTTVHPEKVLNMIQERHASDSEITLLIIDQMMPGITGLELAEKLNMEPSLAKLPKILYSAFNNMELHGPAKKVGVKSVLTKPVNKSYLYDSLVSVIGNQHKHVVVSKEAFQESFQQEFKGIRVLLAEDNLVNQKVAQLHLSKLGCHVHIVENGQEAFEAVVRGDFDVVFMDCQMPVLDGFGATEVIRKHESTHGGHQYIVAMTANAMKGDKEACLAVGMDEYISKPISIDKLSEILGLWLQMHSDRDDVVTPIKQQEQPQQNIQLERMRELFGDDNQVIGEILTLFQKSMHKIVKERLPNAVQKKNATLVAELAHELKGSSANIGGDDISQLCHDIEMCTEQQAWAEIEDKNRILNMSMIALDTMIASLGEL